MNWALDNQATPSQTSCPPSAKTRVELSQSGACCARPRAAPHSAAATRQIAVIDGRPRSAAHASSSARRARSARTSVTGSGSGVAVRRCVSTVSWTLSRSAKDAGDEHVSVDRGLGLHVEEPVSRRGAAGGPVGARRTRGSTYARPGRSPRRRAAAPRASPVATPDRPGPTGLITADPGRAQRTNADWSREPEGHLFAERYFASALGVRSSGAGRDALRSRSETRRRPAGAGLLGPNETASSC
jgi:hypothetical protein